MDKEFLIACVDMVKDILGRVNSKRLISYFAFLAFLSTDPEPHNAYLAAGAFTLALILFMIKPKSSGLGNDVHTN